MNLETFAELQRLRVRKVEIDRRAQLTVRDRAPLDVQAMYRRLFPGEVPAPSDPIRAAYRKLRISYE